MKSLEQSGGKLNDHRGHVLVAFGDQVTEGGLALGIEADE